MDKIPLWAKILGVIVLLAVLFGAAQLLLWMDNPGSFKGGLD